MKPVSPNRSDSLASIEFGVTRAFGETVNEFVLLLYVKKASQNPYPIVEAIQKTVLEATAESVGQAEKEWQHAAPSKPIIENGAASRPRLEIHVPICC